MTRSIPILLYHHIAPDRDITPAAFESQMRWLLDQGYQSIYLTELVRGVRRQSALDRPAFVVTFDDGYLDNWVYAFPILRKLGIKATMFLVTDRVEDHRTPRSLSGNLDTRIHEREPGGFMSWSEAKAMVESGLVTIGSHTQSHRHFVRREPYENIEDELRRSKAAIEKGIGQSCEHLAWPWGDYEKEWLPLVESVGYRSASTVLYGSNAPGTSPYELKRLSVRRPSTRWLNSRLIWSKNTIAATAYGALYGLDRRLKVRWNKESPYAQR